MLNNAKHKRRTWLITLTLLISSAFIFTHNAAAEGGGGLRLALGGIMNITGARVDSSNPAQATGINSSRKVGWGGGLLLEAPILPMLGLETGSLYVNRVFELNNASSTVTRTIHTIFVPLEARLWLLDYLSVAGGGFAAFKIGAQHDEVTSGGTTISSISEGTRQNTDLGFTVAGTLNVAAINKTGVFLEARYNHGFTNASTDPLYEERIDDILIMAGIRVDISH